MSKFYRKVHTDRISSPAVRTLGRTFREAARDLDRLTLCPDHDRRRAAADLLLNLVMEISRSPELQAMTLELLKAAGMTDEHNGGIRGDLADDLAP